jgi:hypothetical protein
MGATPSAPRVETRPARRRLFFTRDAAGWNNVRITFESLVCAAVLTERQLVLPPPSVIDHLPSTPFHELQVYDVPGLAAAVSFASGDQPPPQAVFAGSLQDFLGAEDAGRDVVLDPQSTRIQHFECLGLRGEDARRAARAVLSLGLALPYEEAALRALQRADLRPGEYHAVHLRRGDFAQFRPETQWSGEDLQGRVRAAFPMAERSWPLLVACATAADEADPFPELAAALHERRVVRTDELYGPHDGPLHRVIVDTLLLAKAGRFAGTPDSTYSTGVWHWRARERVLRGEAPESPAGLGQLTTPPASGACWQRCTSFEALRGAAPGLATLAQ